MSTNLDQPSKDSQKIEPSETVIKVGAQEASAEAAATLSTEAAAAQSSNVIDDELEYHTPTADENKIPTTLVCPAAPRKLIEKRTRVCKRKLFGELQNFEIVNREEVDAFLRSGFELNENSAMICKRCKCK